MTEQTSKTAAAQAKTTAKPPKKLVPRTAPVTEPVPPAAAAKVAETPAAAAPQAKPVAPAKAAAKPRAAAKPPVDKAAAPAAPKARPARKPSKVQETVAKHQKVLAEALEMAQAIKYDQPAVAVVAKPKKAGKAEKPAKADKPAKPKKIKLVRDSYAMPEAEYARIGELKKRMAALGHEVKKSELLRGGIATLARLGDAELKAVMIGVERIKTGRPAK